MKLPVTLLALTSLAFAQDIAPKDSERDPVLSALLEAEATTAVSGPSVTVNLSPYSVNEAWEQEEPILVTGNPPIDALFEKDQRPSPKEISGVAVEVEAGTSNAYVDATKIKLLAPFPAKPLSAPPQGWKLVHPNNAPPFSKKVVLASGSSVTLSIRPHVLVPDADGDQVLGLQEPGYKAEDGYAQKDTIGAILADSIMSLDSNSERLNAAAKRLDELLTSLPAPAPAPEPSPISQP